MLLGPDECTQCGRITIGSCECLPEDVRRIVFQNRIFLGICRLLACHSIAVASGSREAGVGFAYDEAEALVRQKLHQQNYANQQDGVYETLFPLLGFSSKREV